MAPHRVEIARLEQVQDQAEQAHAIGALLKSGNRTAAGPTVPPGGLYLTRLWYDDGKVSFHVE